MMLIDMYIVLCLITIVSASVAEPAYDKNLHKKLFDGDVEYERFYWYLRYASLNTFIHLADVYWDKMIERLEEDEQHRAAEWFKDNMTEKEGHWMLAH